MTNPHDRIEEGRRLLAECELAPDFIGRSADDPERDLALFLVKHAELFLHTLPSELEAAHARIAALEARQAQAVEMLEVVLGATLPYQDESGVIRVKLHPFGKIRNAATLLSSAPAETQSNPTPAQAEDVVERVAREIDPGAWSVMDAEKARFLRKYSGETIGYPEGQFQHKTSMAKARAILAIVSDGAAAVEPVGYTNENQLNYVAGGGDGLFFPDDKMGCPIALYRAPPALSALSLDRERIREIEAGVAELAAARKTVIDAMDIYNKRVAHIKDQRNAGDWSLNANDEWLHLQEAERAFHAMSFRVADAFLLQQITNLGDENGD